jgi:hypothetical protein
MPTGSRAAHPAEAPRSDSSNRSRPIVRFNLLIGGLLALMLLIAMLSSLF